MRVRISPSEQWPAWAGHGKRQARRGSGLAWLVQPWQGKSGFHSVVV